MEVDIITDTGDGSLFKESLVGIHFNGLDVNALDIASCWKLGVANSFPLQHDDIAALDIALRIADQVSRL